MNKEEFRQLVKDIRDAESSLGSVDYSLTAAKEKARLAAGRSLYVAKDIKAGEEITRDNIRCVRPGYSLHPRYLNEVLGKKARHDIEFGSRLSIEDYL